MTPCTTRCTRLYHQSLTALLLILMGLLISTAQSARADFEIHFNLLNRQTGAIQQSWKISDFSWGPRIGQFTIDWPSDTAHNSLEATLKDGTQMADVSISYYNPDHNQVLTYTFKYLKVVASRVSDDSGTPMASATLSFSTLAITYDAGDHL